MCDGPYGSDAGANPLMQQDFEKAKALLKEAGYDGYPVVLMDATDIATNHHAALVTAQLLKKIGINVEGASYGLEYRSGPSSGKEASERRRVESLSYRLDFRRFVHSSGEPGGEGQLWHRVVWLVLQRENGGAEIDVGDHYG